MIQFRTDFHRFFQDHQKPQLPRLDPHLQFIRALFWAHVGLHDTLRFGL